jgi:hypothetical protein
VEAVVTEVGVVGVVPPVVAGAMLAGELLDVEAVVAEVGVSGAIPVAAGSVLGAELLDVLDGAMTWMVADRSPPARDKGTVTAAPVGSVSLKDRR